MSLFVCQNPDCQAIENSSCMSIGIDRDSDYPNMHTMDMHGRHEEPIYIGKVMNQKQVVLDHNNNPIDMSYKLPGTVLMLCSECNTGKWHNEFSKDKANEEELKLASLSPYSYITPGFHMDNQIVKDNSCRHGYRAPTEEELIEYGRQTSKRASPYLRLPMYGIDINSLISKYLPKSTAGVVKTQTEEEKNIKLKKAELKREIKQLKKERAYGFKIKIYYLEEEIRSLR